MSESLLVTYCAPTLAGLKTGNLFNCTCTDRRQAEETVRQWNRTLNSKGVYAVIMRYREGRVLIYVYRRAKLLHDFSGTEVRRVLKKFGYEGKNLQEMLEQLSQRLCASDSFPHEIGLFLGYPIEDVKDFIKKVTERAVGQEILQIQKMYRHLLPDAWEGYPSAQTDGSRLTWEKSQRSIEITGGINHEKSSSSILERHG